MGQEQHQRPGPPPPQPLATNGLHGDRQQDAGFETDGSIVDNVEITYNAAERSFKRAGENDGVSLGPCYVP
jgi:hypothetical protein